jgi:hypothetical protein
MPNRIAIMHAARQSYGMTAPVCRYGVAPHLAQRNVILSYSVATIWQYIGRVLCDHLMSDMSAQCHMRDNTRMPYLARIQGEETALVDDD